MRMTPQRWRARIQRSLELQKVRRDEADRFMRAYAGDYNSKPKQGIDGSKDDASVNFIFSFIETVRPALLPGTPKAFVEGEDQESEIVAPAYQALINHWARKLGIKDELKQVIMDWFFGYAAFLTEWDYSEVPVFKPGSSEQDVEPDSITEENPEGEPAFKVLRDQPIAERLNPWDVVRDCDSLSPKKDKWRARRVIYTWEEFKAIPNLSPQIRKKIRPRTLPKELQRGGDEGENYSTERNFVVCWRIYDLENDCTKLMTDQDTVDEFLEDAPWAWEMDAGGDRFPITILEAKWDYSNPYSFSQFKAYWNLIQERNVLRTIIKATVRRNSPGWLMAKGAMDEEQKEKFSGSSIGELTEVNKPDMIMVKPQFVLARDFFEHDSQVAEDTMNTSGLAEYQQQLEANTATQASIAEAKSNVRKGEAKSDFNDFTAVIYTKIGQLNQQFLQEAKALKIRTPRGPEDYKWLDATGEDFADSSFHLTVKPGSDEFEDENLRKQQDLKFAELMATNPHTDQRKLAVRLAKRHGIEPDDILLPEATVQQNQAAAAAAEAAKNAPKVEAQKPMLDFSGIKVELLHPDVQMMIVEAAMKQNKVPESLGLEGSEMPLGDNPNQPPAPASASMPSPDPSSSVMPGAEMNQAPPPMPGAQQPPATPVMPASEMQGGSV